MSEVTELRNKVAKLERQLHEARVQRDGWQELAERLLAAEEKARVLAQQWVNSGGLSTTPERPKRARR